MKLLNTQIDTLTKAYNTLTNNRLSLFGDKVLEEEKEAFAIKLESKQSNSQSVSKTIHALEREITLIAKSLNETSVKRKDVIEQKTSLKTNLETDESYANGQNLVADASQNLTAQDSQQAVKIEGGFETANEAFERGKAEGIVEGTQFAIAETEAAAKMAAKAELEDVVLAFAKAVDALAKPQAVQADTLAGSIHTAILKLASERAGQQIDEMPKSFFDRINALVSSVGKKISEGQVQLNPDDYSLMAPYFTDAALGFVANPDLMRGDVILKFDGVELVDIANNRIGSNYTSEAVTGDVATPIEGVVIASDDAANTDLDGSGASLVDADLVKEN